MWYLGKNEDEMDDQNDGERDGAYYSDRDEVDGSDDALVAPSLAESYSLISLIYLVKYLC